jgi:hypothetical protein
VAGATTAAAATAAPRKAPGWIGGAGAGRSKHRKLNRRLLARALGAGNLLLLIDDNLLKALVAAITDIFVNRHVEKPFPSTPRVGTGAKFNYTARASGHVPAAIDADGLAGNELTCGKQHGGAANFIRRAEETDRDALG